MENKWTAGKWIAGILGMLFFAVMIWADIQCLISGVQEYGTWFLFVKKNWLAYFSANPTCTWISIGAAFGFIFNAAIFRAL